MALTQAEAPATFPYNAEPGTLGPLDSRHMKPEEMPWRDASFPGIRYKTLFVDPQRGQLTVLLEMAPGAVLPDHEHVLVEQTYVLEGFLEDKGGREVGLRVGPGEFVWRPAGSRHVAWAPEGGRFLAIFMMPNRFFADGQVVDMLGQDWQATWGAVHGG